MIIITGAAGFIGSNLVKKLNAMNKKDLVLVDDLNHTLKKQNIKTLLFNEIVGIKDFWNWIEENKTIEIDVIFHLGACSDTLEKNEVYLQKNNVVYSQRLWQLAIEVDCKFIYASSAATYGDGALGFSDSHKLIPSLRPLNAYGQSKQDFDLWVLDQKETPQQWIGLKYFNVYGPGEAQKRRMASVIWHFFQQLKRGDNLKLFDASHGFNAGEQKRDFIYIDDVVKTTIYVLTNNIESGIYNIGTGSAKTFNELAMVLLNSNIAPGIEYIPFPTDLLDHYQAFTCAEMDKLQNTGYDKKYISLDKGIKAYFQYYNNFSKTE
jgi:ADP-L-glycero-D-manno-heptose 6-epimerase